MENAKKSMAFASNCPKCLSAYSESDLQAVRKIGNKQLFHISCQICRSSMMISLSKKQDGILCTGVMTDLSAKDAKYFSKLQPISADDVISLHEQLALDKIIKIV
jgi:hypothetical protein